MTTDRHDDFNAGSEELREDAGRCAQALQVQPELDPYSRNRLKAALRAYAKARGITAYEAYQYLRKNTGVRRYGDLTCKRAMEITEWLVKETAKLKPPKRPHPAVDPRTGRVTETAGIDPWWLQQMVDRYRMHEPPWCGEHGALTYDAVEFIAYLAQIQFGMGVDFRCFRN